MDQELLVDNRIEGGQEVISQLVRDGIQVAAAFWVKSAEGFWRLYIAFPSANGATIAAASGTVYASLSKMPDRGVYLSDIMFVSSSNSIAAEAITIRDRHFGRMPIRYRGERLGNIPIEEAFIYPPPGKWFSGFDEIKKHFPSAEVFTIPVASKPVDLTRLTSYAGQINGGEFEGKPPGTVMFVVPQWQSGKPLGELYFVYRPEGWNTLYRADTNRYEEVRQTITGEPLYKVVDFSPLTALKGSR